MALESTYGTGMMSAGGTNSIERMIESIEIKGKKILDFGSGLGGPSLYLAQKGGVVVGIDSNPWIVYHSSKHIPEILLNRVQFTYYENGTLLPFQNDEFDLIFSKEVLTHIEFKEHYFKEFLRVLKPGDLLIITDWLSASPDWGENMKDFLNSQDAKMYPVTKKDYMELLKKSNFEIVEVKEENEAYLEYYSSLLDSIEDEELRTPCQSIYHAIKSEELLITKIIARALK